MKDAVILVNNDGMGNADVELRQKLIVKYFQLLLQNESLPAAICLYANGVKLAVSGSPALEELKELERRGVRLILCSTCLDYFGLSNQAEVGVVGGMGDILEAQTKAAKVITL